MKPVCCEANVAVFLLLLSLLLLRLVARFVFRTSIFHCVIFSCFVRLGTTQIAFYALVTLEHHSQSDPTKMTPIAVHFIIVMSMTLTLKLLAFFLN